MNASQHDLRFPVLQPVLKVLQVLDLGENLLGNEGIQAIREPLMVNSSVLQLGLAQADITCEGTAHALCVSLNVRRRERSHLITPIKRTNNIVFNMHLHQSAERAPKHINTTFIIQQNKMYYLLVFMSL